MCSCLLFIAHARDTSMTGDIACVSGRNGPSRELCGLQASHRENRLWTLAGAHYAFFLVQTVRHLLHFALVHAVRHLPTFLPALNFPELCFAYAAISSSLAETFIAMCSVPTRSLTRL